MKHWLQNLIASVVVLSMLFSASALMFSVLAYAECKKSDVPPVTIQVVEVTDPVLATSQRLLGEWQEERDQWTYVLENQAKLLGMALDGLVEEIRKGH